MHKKTYLLTFIWVFLLASPASASIEWINGGVCPNDCRKTVIPFLQGATTTYTLKGASLGDVSKNNTEEGLPSGIKLISFNTEMIHVGPQPWDWTGKLTFALLINAGAGKRTLTLKNAAGEKIDDLEIYLVRAGIFSAPDIWPVPNYFNEITLIVGGQKLGGATLDLSGWPQGTTASLFVPAPPPYDTMGQIRFKFPTYLAQASGDIMLWDKGMPPACKNLLATYAYKVTGTNTIRKRITIQGPNAVKSIGFIDGPAYNSGETITIRLTFNRPIGPQAAVVFWRLGPNTGNVTAQAIAPTTYDPNAEFNQRTVNPGATSVDLRIRVCGCLGGGWTVPIRTWFGSTDTSTGPGYIEKSFTVSCPAGGILCP